MNRLQKGLRLGFILIILASLWLYNALSGSIWLSYNMQNLFDGTSGATKYRNFQPPFYTQMSYQQRLINFSHVFIALRKYGGRFDFVALEEVENRQVVEDLRAITPPLKGLNYIAFAKHPTGATGVAFLSKYPIKRVETLDSSLFNTQSRPILILHITFKKHPLIFFIVHLPSNLDATNERARAKAYQLINQKIVQLKASYQKQNIEPFFVLCGDFNDDNPASQLDATFTDLWSYYNQAETAGSFLFQQQWQKLDHFFVSQNLLSSHAPIKIHSFNTFTHPNLLSYTSGNNRIEALQFYQFGNNGYSDHLPIFIKTHYITK